MTSNAQLKPMFKSKGNKPSNQSLFLFVTSIARTNLEVELIQRWGTLVTNTSEPPNPLLPKRDCIGTWKFSTTELDVFFYIIELKFSVPLLHVLAVHARALALWPAWMNLQQLCGLPATPSNALASIEKEVPLLLRDPIALLLQFVLLLPLHVDQGKSVYFLSPYHNLNLFKF